MVALSLLLRQMVGAKVLGHSRVVGPQDLAPMCAAE